MLFHSLLGALLTEHRDFPIAMLNDQSIPPIRSLFKGLMRPVAPRGFQHQLLQVSLQLSHLL